MKKVWLFRSSNLRVGNFSVFFPVSVIRVQGRAGQGREKQVEGKREVPGYKILPKGDKFQDWEDITQDEQLLARAIHSSPLANSCSLPRPYCFPSSYFTAFFPLNASLFFSCRMSSFSYSVFLFRFSLAPRPFPSYIYS